MIHDIIMTKFQKYPSDTILKHENVLAKRKKLTWGRLNNLQPHSTYVQ